MCDSMIYALGLSLAQVCRYLQVMLSSGCEIL